MRRLLRGPIRWLAVGIVLGGSIVAVGFAVASSGIGRPTAVAPTHTPYVVPTPTPWLVSVAPGQVQMPAGADCKACHETAGGVIGVKDIPVVPHPTLQWSNCTACHDNARLVMTAAGHSGIHADQCLVCHTQSLGAAPPPAHMAAPDAKCLTCHGITAPLPSTMSHRPGNLCWLCHLSPSSSSSPAPS